MTKTAAEATPGTGLDSLVSGHSVFKLPGGRSAELRRDLKYIALVVLGPEIFAGGTKQVAGWVASKARRREFPVPTSGKVVQHPQLAGRIHYKGGPKPVGTTAHRGAIDVASFIGNQHPVGGEPVCSLELVHNLELARVRNLEQNSADIFVTAGGAIQFAVGWVEEKAAQRKVTVFAAVKGMQDGELSVLRDFEHRTAALAREALG